jgi:hypothetical protein
VEAGDAPAIRKPKEVNGVVKNDVVKFLGEPLTEGTLVKIRKKE